MLFAEVRAQSDEQMRKKTQNDRQWIQRAMMPYGSVDVSGSSKRNSVVLRPGTGPRRKTHMLRAIMTAFYH